MTLLGEEIRPAVRLTFMVIIIGVGLLVAVIISVGLVVARKIQGDTSNFLVAGRGLILPLAAASLMGQAVDTNATLGNTDLASEFGFWAGAALPIGLATCLFLTGLFFAKPMNRMGLLTLPDFYRRKYGRLTERTVSLVMIMAFAILLAGNLVAGGFLFEAFLGTSYVTGIFLILGAVLLYTVAGGMMADAYTAVIQMAVNVVASLGLLLWVLFTFGLAIPEGMGPLALEQLTSSEHGAYINWATLAALGIGDIVAIDFMQRIFSAADPETAQRACFGGAAGVLLVGIPFSLVALAAPAILAQEGIEPGTAPVLYLLLDNMAPVGLAVLVLGGIVAASFSTANGAILGTSAVWTRNVLGVREDPAKAGDALLTGTRVFMFPISAIAVFFAIRVPETGILLVLAFDLLLAGLVVPFIAGLFWPKANAKAAMSCILIGSGVRVALFVLMPTTYGMENTLLYIPNEIFSADFDGIPTFISAVTGAVTFIVVTLRTQRSSPPRDRALLEVEDLV